MSITSPLFILYLEVCTFWPLSHISPTSHPLPLPTTHSVFCICDLWVILLFNSTYKDDYMAFVLLWLISLSIMPSRSMHVVEMARFLFFFFRLNNILCCICMYTTTSLPIHGYYFSWYLHFKERVPRSLRKTFLGYKANKRKWLRPIQSSK